MTNLVVRRRAVPGADGLLVSITRESAGWSYVGFDVYRLARGANLDRATGQHEVCAVLLSGRADVSFGSNKWAVPASAVLAGLKSLGIEATYSAPVPIVQNGKTVGVVGAALELTTVLPAPPKL